MPDVSSCAPEGVRRWVALDAHKLSIVVATLPVSGGRPEVSRIENTPTAIRRLILAAEFVRDHLAGFEVERTDAFGGEVMVSRTADKLLQPAHH